MMLPDYAVPFIVSLIFSISHYAFRYCAIFSLAVEAPTASPGLVDIEAIYRRASAGRAIGQPLTRQLNIYRPADAARLTDIHVAWPACFGYYSRISKNNAAALVDG